MDGLDKSLDDLIAERKKTGGDSRACHSCGQTGHVKAACPSRGGGGGGGGLSSIVCRNCNGRGHKAAECNARISSRPDARGRGAVESRPFGGGGGGFGGAAQLHKIIISGPGCDNRASLRLFCGACGGRCGG